MSQHGRGVGTKFMLEVNAPAILTRLRVARSNERLVAREGDRALTTGGHPLARRARIDGPGRDLRARPRRHHVRPSAADGPLPRRGGPRRRRRRGAAARPDRRGRPRRRLPRRVDGAARRSGAATPLAEIAPRRDRPMRSHCAGVAPGSSLARVRGRARASSTRSPVTSRSARACPRSSATRSSRASAPPSTRRVYVDNDVKLATQGERWRRRAARRGRAGVRRLGRADRCRHRAARRALPRRVQRRRRPRLPRPHRRGRRRPRARRRPRSVRALGRHARALLRVAAESRVPATPMRTRLPRSSTPPSTGPTGRSRRCAPSAPASPRASPPSARSSTPRSS